MEIYQIRNATVKLKYRGITFLIDPWFQDKGTGFSAKAMRPEMQGLKNPLNDLPDKPESILADVELCLITHVHPDHISMDYIPADERLVAQSEKDVDLLKNMGFTHVETFADDCISVKDVTIHRVCGVHGDTPEAISRMGEVSGYVLQSPNEKTLYIAGDTIYYSGVKENIVKFNPEVIILNCCAATTPFGRLIMDLEDVSRVCQDAPEAVIIASHLDSVNHAMLNSSDVKAYAAENGFNQIKVPANGEMIEV